jgi:hypothetical protein
MRAKVDSKPIKAWKGADNDDTAEGVAASRMDGWKKEALDDWNDSDLIRDYSQHASDRAGKCLQTSFKYE